MRASSIDPDVPWYPRDREAQRLALSLRNARLTMLFGAPGSGKTSLLRAGVLPLLRRRAIDTLPAQERAPRVVVPFPDRRRKAAEAGPERELAVLVDDWHAASPAALIARIDSALGIAPAHGAAPLQATLADHLRALGRQRGLRFLLLLDRADALLTAAASPGPGRSAARACVEALAGVLADSDVPAHVLLALRSEEQPGLGALIDPVGDDDIASLWLPPLRVLAPTLVDAVATTSPPPAPSPSPAPASKPAPGQPMRAQDVYASIESWLGSRSAAGAAPLAAAAADDDPTALDLSRIIEIARQGAAAQPPAWREAEPARPRPDLPEVWEEPDPLAGGAPAWQRHAVPLSVGVVALLLAGFAAVWWQQQGAALNIARPAPEVALGAASPRLEADAPPAPAAPAPLPAPTPAPPPAPPAATRPTPLPSATTAAPEPVPPSVTNLAVMPRLVLRTDAEDGAAGRLEADLQRIVAPAAGLRFGPGPAGTRATDAELPLAVAGYDALQRARGAGGPAASGLGPGPIAVVMPLYTEGLMFVARADAPLARIDQIRGRRLNIGPGPGRRGIAASTVYRLMFGTPVPRSPGLALDREAALRQMLAASPRDRRAPEVLVLVGGESWWQGLPAAQRSRLKLLALDRRQPASRKALQSYLPLATAGTPGLGQMSFLVATGPIDTAAQEALQRFAESVCSVLPQLRREGGAKWREVQPGLQFDTGWPQASAAQAGFRACAPPA